MPPSRKTSVRSVTLPAVRSNCSGAMYTGVPALPPASVFSMAPMRPEHTLSFRRLRSDDIGVTGVSGLAGPWVCPSRNDSAMEASAASRGAAPRAPSSVIATARPQSVTCTSPNSPTSTLSGLRSRCTIPREWANAMASMMRSNTSKSRSRGQGSEPLGRCSVRPLPRMRFITQYGTSPSCSGRCNECTGTMLGCSSRAVTHASRARFSIAANDQRSGRRALTATSRPSSRCT